MDHYLKSIALLTFVASLSTPVHATVGGIDVNPFAAQFTTQYGEDLAVQPNIILAGRFNRGFRGGGFRRGRGFGRGFRGGFGRGFRGGFRRRGFRGHGFGHRGFNHGGSRGFRSHGFRRF